MTFENHDLARWSAYLTSLQVRSSRKAEVLVIMSFFRSITKLAVIPCSCTGLRSCWIAVDDAKFPVDRLAALGMEVAYPLTTTMQWLSELVLSYCYTCRFTPSVASRPFQ